METTPDPSARPSWVDLLDEAPESAGIDLAAVRRYRLDRVRAEMAERTAAKGSSSRSRSS